MIEPVKRGGRELAICQCEICLATVEVPAMHGHSNGEFRPGKSRLTIQNEAIVIKRLADLGWTHVKGRLRCPECEAKRKTAKEPAVENMTALRQPTREQKREIIQMLESVYDTKASRYSGAETDQTVASVMGGGIMPGWVAEIRDELFGPSGANHEMESLAAEIAGYQAQVKALEKTVADELKSLDVLTRRLEAIKKAVGPKAVSA